MANTEILADISIKILAKTNTEIDHIPSHITSQES